ncbi:biotin/lipoyl-containing protein [Lipingzhangella sp. LS1_29]|uniref:Biotin/lipoyl-containing protein n=1 Tax=Lipingzhangella rawalii TaxID=2055835 RepID=A0ABU2H6S5_9ACTN|nr:biotin/lipoyl-containing protein [Lipingzhangella rawalii]MDS1271006.1 biotin/lipoyl-containing protein [Lipingzhangella rawalii]
MSEQTFVLPDLGEGLVEATVVEWLVTPGQHVERNEAMVEVETTKSTVEIPSPCSGTVTQLHAEPGTVVPVGAPLVSFSGDDPGTSTDSTETATGAAEGREHGSDSAGIVGTVPTGSEPRQRRVRLRPPEE